MNRDNLVDQCCDLHGLKLPKLCEKYPELNLATMKLCRKNLPPYGKLLLEKLMENYHLEKENKELKEKVQEASKILTS